MKHVNKIFYTCKKNLEKIHNTYLRNCGETKDNCVEFCDSIHSPPCNNRIACCILHVAFARSFEDNFTIVCQCYGSCIMQVALLHSDYRMCHM